ncbi:MAG TPA: FAD-binding protein [Actinomycetota bacterium]
MDLIAPTTRAELAAALRDASRRRRRLLVFGGRTHLAKGNHAQVDAALTVTAMDRLVEHTPAEMVAVVEAGMTCRALDQVLAAHGQEWPVDAPDGATVGGVVAVAASSPRRLRVGPVRDSVLEVELVTGDGREVRGGARTVKNVSGYDLPRLATGSLGCLGVIAQVALKLRPRPRARRSLLAGGGLDAAAALLAAVPLPTAVLATRDRVELRLEGWPEDLAEQTELARGAVGPVEVLDDAAFPSLRPWQGRPVVAEAAVPPSRLPRLVAAAGDAWAALAGVGVCWVGLPAGGAALADLRRRADDLGGIAPVVRGPGGLGGAAPAPAIYRRLKQAFDPAGILAPGRFWGGL